MFEQFVVTFPARARIYAVATAFGIAAGAEREIKKSSSGDFVDVGNVIVTGYSCTPEAACINLKDSAGRMRALIYRHEFGPEGERGMLIRYDHELLAIARNVVCAFGGSIQLHPSKPEFDLVVESRWPYDPDGKGHAAIQQLLQEVQAVDAAQLEAAKAAIVAAQAAEKIA